MFPIIDVSSWEVYRAEPMGTKAKDWRLSPDDGQPWLLKLNRKDNRTGIFAGEDWSEKIAAELAELLGIPHAIVELASVNSLPGVIVKDFVSDRTKKKLTHGNELLAATISAYPKEQKRGVVQHTISRVLDALSESYVHLPAGWNAPRAVQSPAEVFTGYLMLDVLIGNTDRHHENWAIVETQEGARQVERYAEISPTYDHASCLGRELTDDHRQQGLTGQVPSKSPASYRQKCRSAFFATESDTSTMTPFAAFQLAAQKHPNAARTWLQKLSLITPSQTDNLFSSIPSERISTDGRKYASMLLLLNLGELVAMKV
ncbi:MAG: HipA domain-containing protein [Verrucomicrobiota bacterium]